jgi:hypothetical protein
MYYFVLVIAACLCTRQKSLNWDHGKNFKDFGNYIPNSPTSLLYSLPHILYYISQPTPQVLTVIALGRCQVTKPQMYSLRYCQGQIWYSVQLTIPVQAEHKTQIPIHAISAFPNCASWVQHMTHEQFFLNLVVSLSPKATVRKTRMALSWAFQPLKSQLLLYISSTYVLLWL